MGILLIIGQWINTLLSIDLQTDIIILLIIGPLIDTLLIIGK